MGIRAITFDFWDTVVRDGSDEPKRAALGLRDKHAERRHQVWEALNAVEPIPRERVFLAYDTAEAGFHATWRENAVNWTVEQRLRIVVEGLGRSLPEEAFARLVERHARMEVEVPPDPVEGVSEALERLARRFPLAVVSDAIVTPGRAIRELLERYGLLKHFSAFAFSDEIGRSKPDPAMFDHVCRKLGVAPAEIVHVGDREATDVRGVQALGGRAVLFAGARKNDLENTRADAVCHRMADLPGIIEELAACAA